MTVKAAAYAACAVVLLVGIIIWTCRLVHARAPKSIQELGVPLVGQSKGRRMEFRQLIDAAANMTPKSPFLLRSFGTEYVVFPSEHFDEIKRLPEALASGVQLQRNVFNEPWSGIPRHSHELLKAVSVDLARVVPSLVPKRQQDCGIACEEAIGYCLDWKEVVLFPALQEIVVSTNASVFVGRDLGRSKAWTSTVQRLPLAVAIPTFLIGYAPAFLKSLFKPIIFAPAIWIRFRMSRMLRPVLQKDVDMYWTSKGNGVLEVSPVNDKVPLSRWLLQRYPAGVKDVYSRLMDDYISLSFESTPSSAGTLYYILVELAADPELAEVLRKEVLSITLDGKLPSTQLSELDKMDSVMRESARVNPFSYLVLYRRVMQPLQLSAGPLLPAGTNICVDAHHINFSPELWERPFEFDGLRHHRARQKQKERSGKKNSFRFANLAADYPGWGDGLQACPGRAFADNTLKIILARLLIQYEFRLRPGEGKPKKGSMPNGSMYPDVKARIMFRSRRWASG